MLAGGDDGIEGCPVSAQAAHPVFNLRRQIHFRHIGPELLQRMLKRRGIQLHRRPDGADFLF